MFILEVKFLYTYVYKCINSTSCYRENCHKIYNSDNFNINSLPVFNTVRVHERAAGFELLLYTRSQNYKNAENVIIKLLRLCKRNTMLKYFSADKYEKEVFRVTGGH